MNLDVSFLNSPLVETGKFFKYGMLPYVIIASYQTISLQISHPLK